MLALIDGDVLCYQCGYTTEDVEEWIARARMREMIYGVLKDTGATDFQIYLSDSKGNWRLKLFPAYKANRTQPKPKHLPYLQNLLVSDWDAIVAEGEEADDALGIEQTKYNFFEEDPEYGGDATVICSIDKDLKQIPGNHYNWDKKEKSYVTPSEGLYRFYYQLLVGDPGDNISVKEGLSCRGIGGKKALSAIEGCETEGDYFSVVKALYHKQWQKDLTPQQIDDILLLTGRLIKIRTKPGEIWNFPFQPKPDQEVQQQSHSTSEIKVENHSTEHTGQEQTGYPVAGPERDSTSTTNTQPI